MNLDQWRDYRNKSVVSPQGDLGLVQMVEITQLQEIANVPGMWKPKSKTEPGLMVMTTKMDGLRIDGELIEGTKEIIADQTIIELPDGRTAMATSQPGSLHLLAIWDQTIEAIKMFERIDCYPFQENWVVKGILKQSEEEEQYEFSHTGDVNKTRSHISLGRIEVEIGNKLYSLIPFDSEGTMIVVFRDATSGNETYGMGRMVIVQMGENNKEVILDFNKAFLPPCAFSMHFNCPMPPLSNRIQVNVEAGEKNIILKK